MTLPGNMGPAAPDSHVEPSVVVAGGPLCAVTDPNVQDEIILAADSDEEFEYDANEWAVSPPHPSEFVRPPPILPIYYVVTIGEEAGIYDGTWAESFDIRRVSRLEQFAMRTFRDWDEAHAHYTHEFNLNHVANASQRPPSLETPRLAAPVANPTVGMARAQSAPPMMLSVGTHNGNPIHTAAPPTLQPQCGTLPESGTRARPFYVPSTWPTPVIVRARRSRAAAAAVTQPAAAPVAQPAIPAAQHVVAGPAQIGPLRGLLPTILEKMDRPRRPMTQLHFDSLGRLINPGPISVPSSPEDVDLAPVRKPQPFPLIPDANLFTYPTPQRQQNATNTPERPLSFPASTPSELGEAYPATPFLQSPSQIGRLVNLSPLIENSASTRGSTVESEGVENVAKALFLNGVTPQSSASTTKRGPPVASSSTTARVMRKRESPSTPTSKTTKPTKVRKTTSTKKSRRAAESAPSDDEPGKYASLWADDE